MRKVQLCKCLKFSVLGYIISGFSILTYCWNLLF